MDVSRRRFLLASGSSLSAAWLCGTGMSGAMAAPARFKHDPFRIGVASGSLGTDGFVIWTRLLGDPAVAPMPDAPVAVHWEVARDSGFRRIIHRGTTQARAQFAHSVHVEVSGLPAAMHGAVYWYRFSASGVMSAVGRTRTLPNAGSDAPLHLALASCQNWQRGYFNAYRHMAEEALDLVVFSGDYIYEYGSNPGGVRTHDSGECHTLDEYRQRYALYKSDPDLQRAHAAFPWLVTPDDHEVTNDYADDRAPSGRGAEFLLRRAAAFRAYWEHQPLRWSQLPDGPHMQLFQRFAWGATANLHMLDARQYRDHQPCLAPHEGGSRTVRDEDCAERRSSGKSLLGARQEDWLTRGLAAGNAAFEIVVQQSLMAQMRMGLWRGAPTAPADRYWTDSWDGYPEARARLLQHFGAKGNVISLGGDVHATYISDLKADFEDADSPTLASEVVGTSISSPSWQQATTERVLRNNPHIRFGKSDQRGYTLLQVGKDVAAATLRVIDNARVPSSEVSTAGRFVIEAGRPGVQRA